MPDIRGNAYGLTCLCPIRPGAAYDDSGRSHLELIRCKLDSWALNERSPMARVPNTYLSRFFVLDRVIYQGVDLLKIWPQPRPAKEDRLKSAYLVFSSNFHGTDIDPYLYGMWEGARESIIDVFQHCVGFDSVNSAATFCQYIRRCRVETTFYFNGSTDESLAEQLKGLYLKQELSRFVFEHEGQPDDVVQQAFIEFLARVRPDDLSSPTWRPGASSLDVAVDYGPSHSLDGSQERTSREVPSAGGSDVDTTTKGDDRDFQPSEVA